MSTTIDFISFTADDTEGTEARRQIRSRAAQFSHRIGPRKPKSRQSSRQSSRKSSVATVERIPLPVPRQTSVSSSRSANNVATSELFHQGSERAVRHLATSQEADHTSWPTNTSFDSVANARFNFADILNSSRIGYSHQLPVPELPWYGSMLDFMWPWMLRSWTILDTTPEEREEALPWIQTLTLAEPAYFYMNMLSAGTSLSRIGQFDSALIPWLLFQVVRSVNEALSDHQRAFHVGIILTVGRIALHEIVLGDAENGSMMHRPAQVRMIAMAGGLDNLGLPSLVYKHVAWADRLMTERTGVSMVDLFPAVVRSELPRGNIVRDQQMLQAYVPDQRISGQHVPDLHIPDDHVPHQPSLSLRPKGD